MSRRDFARASSVFTGFLLVIWCALYAVWYALPSIRPGHFQIYDAKQQIVATGDVLPSNAPVRVVVFGNSKVLAGFRPDLFDALSNGRVVSYNLGLPDSRRFIEEIETLARRGQAPTHVLLTTPWSGEGGMTLGEYLRADFIIIRDLFPFRDLPRDLVGFWRRSRANGGLRAYYARNIEYVDQVIRDRGYFFIENMSRFPNHRLPDDFHLESETPEAVWPRDCPPTGPLFERLITLSRREGISLLIVPTYFREHSYASAGSNDATRTALAPYGVTVAGPDYWLYPNGLFSDPDHLNREGADLHTRRLWELTESSILPASAPPAS